MSEQEAALVVALRALDDAAKEVFQLRTERDAAVARAIASGRERDEAMERSEIADQEVEGYMLAMSALSKERDAALAQAEEARHVVRTICRAAKLAIAEMEAVIGESA